MKTDDRSQVIAFTDGSSLGNPGPGGYGIVLKYNGRCREISGGFRRTTNNRMELLAAIEGLAALKRPCTVTLYSDSRYVVDAMSKGWAQGWQARGWRGSRKQPVANPDLWQRLIELCDIHDVTFRWVKGHSGHPENERCDRLAVAAAESNPTTLDDGYERRDRGDGFGETSALGSSPNLQRGLVPVDWSRRLMTEEEVEKHDLRLSELTESSPQDEAVQFLCPILLRDERAILCRGHVLPKSVGSSADTVLQRKDVDNFFGSFVEADFGHGVNIRGLSFSDTIKYMLDKHPSSRLKWLLRSDDGDETQVKVGHFDKERFAVYGAAPDEKVKYEMGFSYDLRYATLLSCLHSVHLGQFRALGYSYVNSNAGRYIAKLLADVFETFKGRKGKDEGDGELERLCFTHRNMVRPVLGDIGRIDRRLLERPFEWFIVAWDGDVPFATIHFLGVGDQLNAVMVYNLQRDSVLPTTALVVSQRPLSFTTSVGWFDGQGMQIGPPGERISWPCGEEVGDLKPYPIRRAVNDLQRHLEGMPESYSIF